MKRTVILSVGMVALLGTAVYVGHVWAQSAGAGRPAAPSTRIALLNLSHVIKNYEKYKSFQDELKAAVEPFSKKDMAAKTEGDNLAKEMSDPNTKAEKKEANERRLKELQRQVEDIKVEANKVLVKKQEEQLKILYMDVRSVAERLAQANGYEMVLHYNDHVTATDYWSPQNIARKMQAGALMPMYYVGGLDISQEVINNLNASYKSAPRAAATGTPAAAAPAAGRPGN